MKRGLIILGILSQLLSFNIYSQSGDACAESTGPKRIPVNPPMADIEWWSDADLIDSTTGKYQLSRAIINRISDTRSVTWKRAGIQIARLQKGHWARYCPDPGIGFMEEEGEIQYLGYGEGQKANVYISKNELDSKEMEIHVKEGRPLILTTKYYTGKNEKNNPIKTGLFGRIDKGIIITTELSKADNIYQLKIKIENKGEEHVKLTLDGFSVNHTKKYSDMLAPLRRGDFIVMEFDLNEFPLLVKTAATLSNAEGNITDRFDVTTLIPKSGW